MKLIASQCRARGVLGAKIFEGMFAAMPSFATTAAAAVFALNHASCTDITTRYLAAFLNDMTRSAGLVQEMIEGSEEYLQVRTEKHLCWVVVRKTSLIKRNQAPVGSLTRSVPDIRLGYQWKRKPVFRSVTFLVPTSERPQELRLEIALTEKKNTE